MLLLQVQCIEDNMNKNMCCARYNDMKFRHVLMYFKQIEALISIVRECFLLEKRHMCFDFQVFLRMPKISYVHK